MANKFASNYPITSSSNIFAPIWKLTRTMKAAGWTYMASGDGVYQDAVQVGDLWGSSGDPTTDTYSTVSTYITSGSNGVALPTGTINVNSTTSFPSSGTFTVRTQFGLQTITYTNTSGGNQFTGCTGGTGNLATNSWVGQGSVNYSFENAPVVSWIVFRGPSTIKIPLSANPTGNFVRGETITQASTAAEGELIGYIWDTGTNSGWAVVAPHTGTWDNSHTVTGSTSGATFVPTGTIVTFLREFMFVRGSGATGQTQGGMYYICADGLEGTTSGISTTTTTGVQSLPTGTINVASTTGFPSSGYLLINTSVGLQKVQYTNTSGGNSFTGCTGGTGNTSNGGSVAQAGSESDQLFSTIATSSGCTASNPPGWGGTNNAFPLKGIVCKGNGTGAVDPWVIVTSAFLFNSQMGCMNATPAASTSADGSFWISLSQQFNLNSSAGFMFCRLDDTEPGDCDPYIFAGNMGQAAASFTGQTATSFSSVASYWYLANFYQNSGPIMVGYQARGNPNTIRDQICGYKAGYQLSYLASSSTAFLTTTNSTVIYPKSICTPASITTPFRDSVCAFCVGGFAANYYIQRCVPHWKGRLRWLQMAAVGNIYDTYDSKNWICVSNTVAQVPVLLLPYDGTSSPIQ